ncbi:MAG: sigma-70 family RNA polymerase sigma factor [Gemmatimonadaceae bacterium]
MTDEHELLARRFEADRVHLRGVAYRMLGSAAEADDAVQEAWLRLSRERDLEVANLTGWLTTVVSRVCLDMLRSRESRREDSFDITPIEIPNHANAQRSPAEEVVLAESVGLALLVVLNSLAPAERLAFVLHDMFAMPFDEIAPIVGKSPAAARQLASRARRRVRGEEPRFDGDVAEQRRVVDAFVAALSAGDFAGLIAILDPNFVMRADAFVGKAGTATEVHGAETWARGAVRYGQMVRFAQPALIDGTVGLVVAPHGKLDRVLVFTIDEGKVASIVLIADPDRLRELTIDIISRHERLSER